MHHCDTLTYRPLSPAGGGGRVCLVCRQQEACPPPTHTHCSHAAPHPPHTKTTPLLPRPPAQDEALSSIEAALDAAAAHVASAHLQEGHGGEGEGSPAVAEVMAVMRTLCAAARA